MSSGVDSSVAAALLLQDGHPAKNIIPFYMANWSAGQNPPPGNKPLPYNKPARRSMSPLPKEPEPTKCAEREYDAVRQICRVLGLADPLYLSFEREYWLDVWEPMVEAYRRGLTPNPDVSCNRFVKFGAVLDRLGSMAHGEPWLLATGHYARVAVDPSSGSYHILRSADAKKDQTFFLSTIDRKTLPNLIFPLGQHRLSKDAVKSMARKLMLPGWQAGEKERRESFGICFIEPGGGKSKSSFRRFLKEYLVPQPGSIVTGPWTDMMEETDRSMGRHVAEGFVIGRHEGLWHATIGEKARLTIPRGNKALNGRWFVSRKFPERNEIEVVKGQTNRMLFSTGMILCDWRWLGDYSSICENFKASSDQPAIVAQYRHVQTPLKVKSVETIHRKGVPMLKVMLEAPAKAVAPGQSAALWMGEECLGGGVIEESIPVD